MANYDDELLAASRHLFTRRNGQRGRLPSARIRRSISTSYYALFHFMLDEIGRRIVGTQNGLRVRRRVVARTIGHASIKRTLDKARGGTFDLAILPFISSDVNAVPLAVPRFVRNLALAFIDAHAKREDADYNLNEELSAADARCCTCASAGQFVVGAKRKRLVIKT